MAKFVVPVAAGVLLVSLSGFWQASAEVFFNEIMYHPAPAVPEDPQKEWIELHNTGTNAVTLSGWRLTKGVDFTFTNTTIPAGGYLVVAANAAAFATNYPGVTNVAGNWTGKLNNNGETIELTDNLGGKADSVTYAGEGDWALLRTGEQYPGQPGWWRGWGWTNSADGLGKSIELINPALSSKEGQNWSASLADGGTPGRANSVGTNNIAPMILDVRHFPAIPSSTNTVTITARIVDETISGLTVQLFSRLDGAGSFTSTTMFDDGAHGDGAAGDGYFGVVLSAQSDKTIVEFYVQAIDAGGNTRTWPAPTDSTGTQGANALYQVDETSYSGSQPLYRLITKASEWSTWLNLMDVVSNGRYSESAMNATLVRSDGLGTEIRYNVLVRNRGAGTRAAHPHNMRLNIPADRDLQGVTEVDLNTRTVHSQVAGNALFSLAGLPNAYGTPAQVRINSANLANPQPDGSVDSYQFGSYFCFQSYSSDWAAAHLPQDPQGNIYKGVWYQDYLQLTNGAVFDWRGTNAASYRLTYGPSGPIANTGAYSKQSNKSEDDWSDLITLCSVLNLTPSSNYLQAVSQVVDIDEWLRYFAANSLIINMETTFGTGVGDDYSMYCGVNDPRFQILNHDMDTVLGQGDSAASISRSIFQAASIAAVDRFLKNPGIAPRYYAALLDMANSSFATSNLNATLDQALGGWVPTTYIQSMKDVAAARRAAVLGQIPLSLSVTSALPVTSGYPRTTTASASLTGVANAIETSTVLVNGLPAAYTPWLGSWSVASLALTPGINRILVQSLNTNGVEFARTNIDVWYDDSTVQAVGGTIASDTTWTAAGGPYGVTSNLTIATNATLTIQPGTTIYLGSGVNVTVANGGRLLAEGTAVAPIRFTVTPGLGVSWGGLTVNGAVSSPETRIAYAHFEGNGSICIKVAGGTLYLDHTTFGTTTHQYLSLDSSSFLISHCDFPTTTAAFELLHGTGGIKSGGQGIVRDCYFGTTTGYNDIMDFTGGNRDLGQPIIQYYNNVFTGASDDILDLDGTDAWVEGNIFLHAHRNGSPDSSSAVSGGNYDYGSGAGGVRTSEITMVRNLIFDCDQAANAKQGNFYTLLNNTIVHTTKVGGMDSGSAVIILGDEGTTSGAGCYLEGNVIVDAEALVRNYSNTLSTVTFSNNLMPFAWTGPGGGNSTNDARLKYVPQNSETQFASWEQAQIMRDWFSLRSGSPARGAGPNHQDMGAVIPSGATISGELSSPTTSTSAMMSVGTLLTGDGIPTAGFPQGSGFTHYKYRLDDAAWSAETPIATPVTLTGLANGSHHVDVIGRRDSGGYQNATELGGDATITASRTWTVNTALNRVLINELLADNRSAWHVGEATPDAIELYNPDALPVTLSGMGLSDNPANPYKFSFPAGTVLNGGQFLVVVADTGSGTNFYTGFKLDKDGGSLTLFATPASGGASLDSVSYGPQLTDFSIGRLADGSWGLTQPTFGGPNLEAPTGDVEQLRLNEWLAASLTRDDFVEFYNGDALPVNLGGCYLSDVPDTWPARFQIAPLSFISGKGALEFIADGNSQNSPRHLNFSLAQEWGTLGLFAPDLTLLDRILYGPQTADVSMGRTPNGGSALAFFATPTPGSGNPGSTGSCTISNITVNLMAYTQVWRFNQSNNLDGMNWTVTNYNDATWQSGPGLLAFENNPAITNLIKTTLLAPGSPPPGLGAGHAYYFRTTLKVTNDLTGFTLNARMRLDDCGVIYINGTEFSRPRMPVGVITNGTFGGGATGSGSDADADEYFSIPISSLHLGTNTFAVEVHQVNATSSDIVWGMALDAVRSVTNCVTPTAVLNEVLANNLSYTNADGSVTDWVELFNPSATPVSLSGMSLTDDPGNARRWVFPAGVVLNGNSYLKVKCDSGSSASATNAPVLNTGFGLKAAGGTVYLYNTDASLLDAVTYGQQAADFSIARVPDGNGSWTLGLPTPGSVNIATVPGDASALRINEWAANVSTGPDWFELFNPNPQPVALGGCYLTDKLSNRTKHRIAPLSFIGVGNSAYATFVADNDPAQGADHVNFSLDDKGEAIGLFPPGTSPAIDSVTFGVQASDISEGRFLDGAANRVFFTTPSPGAANWLPLTNVVINELLTHTDPPLEDAIELHNLTDVAVNLGGWWISNDKDQLEKFQVPTNTIIAPHGYVVFYEYQFNPEPGVGNSFEFISWHDDSVWLSATDNGGQLSGYRDHVKYGPQFNGVSFGRVPTSAGVDFAAMQAITFGTSVTASSPPNQLDTFRTGAGAVNTGPRIGPVIISEIMYHPLPLGTNDNVRDEFIELYNLTSTNVPLYDLAHSTNGWRLRGAVDFDFNTNHTIAPGGFLLVVSFDPAINGNSLNAFRAAYGTNGTLVGPYSGKLDNGGEVIGLYAPDKPETLPPNEGLVPYVLVEQVAYSDAIPWPTNADGGGQSLQRLTLAAYGNDPANWIAAAPTAGFISGTDSDADGMPDAWEDAHGLNKTANDAALDPDHDGFSNLQEYLAGTDPQSAASALRILSATRNGNATDIQFQAVAGKTYSVLYRNQLTAGSWQKLSDVSMQATTQTVTVQDSPNTNTTRFYRLVTPAAP